jgi:hypothetical protein
MLRRHGWTILTALAAIAVLSPACSSNSTSPAPTSSTNLSSAPTAPQAHGAYEQCLADHGVPAPGGLIRSGSGPGPQGPPPGPPPEGTPGAAPPPPPGVDQATWDTAISACKSLAPSPPGGSR